MNINSCHMGDRVRLKTFDMTKEALATVIAREGRDMVVELDNRDACLGTSTTHARNYGRGKHTNLAWYVDGDVDVRRVRKAHR